MLKLGVIGTGWITKQFVDAAAATKAYTLTAVYSRHQESAQTFIDQTAPATAYTKMDDFLGSDVDVVYIASPNSLHASQALAALDAGKHVIVEKPLVATAMEFEKLDEALRKSLLCIFLKQLGMFMSTIFRLSINLPIIIRLTGLP